MEKGVDRLLPLLLVLSSPPSSPSPCAAPSSVFRCFVRTPPKDNQAVGRCREVVGTSISTAAWTLEVSPAEQGSGSNGAALAGQTLQTPKVHKKCYLVPPYLSLSYYYCSHSICHLTMCSAYASHTIYKCTTRVTRIQWLKTYRFLKQNKSSVHPFATYRSDREYSHILGSRANIKHILHSWPQGEWYLLASRSGDVEFMYVVSWNYCIITPGMNSLLLGGAFVSYFSEMCQAGETSTPVLHNNVATHFRKLIPPGAEM